MDRDALPEKENLRHAGDDEQNAETLRSEVTGLIAQVPVDSSSSLKSRERTDALNSSHRINPEVEQTEAQQGTEERDATPPVDDDLGPFISDVAMQPICTTGRLGDLFIGSHKVVGKIALKRIRVGDTQAEAEALRTFERKANPWRRRPQHHLILDFLGTYTHGGHLHLVSQFIENGNVLKYIGKHPDVNRVRLLCETSEAIDYLHRQTIVHGDIKASNILVGVDGHVLLCDVGLAGMLPAQISLSWKGVGTFRWQSPELWDDDDGTRTFASDVYAFSMTIAEVLTGKLPFPHIHNDAAVVPAVYGSNERPEKTPMESNGVSYEIAWQVAEACWPGVPGDRISMSEAFRLLKGDPSLT